MLDSVFNVTETSFSITSLLLAIATAIGLGLIVSFVNMKTQVHRGSSQSFNITLVLLPAIICVIILLVGSNIARAFSLAGAFSIIRFRSAAGDPKEISLVLMSSAIGLACGTGYLLAAVIVTIILCLVMILLERFQFGQSQTKLLKITIPEDLDYQDAFTNLLQRFTSWHQFKQVKTTNLGSLYQLSYLVILKKEAKEKEFLDEIRCRNSNLNITFMENSQQKEY